MKNLIVESNDQKMKLLIDDIEYDFGSLTVNEIGDKLYLDQCDYTTEEIEIGEITSTICLDREQAKKLIFILSEFINPDISKLLN